MSQITAKDWSINFDGLKRKLQHQRISGHGSFTPQEVCCGSINIEVNVKEN